jgi:DTW domain-containing protein YfiP
MSHNYAGRCQKCYMREEVCLCADLPRLNLATHLTVIMHAKENKKTTNTGRIACLALPNSSLHFRGVKDSPLDNDLILKSDYVPMLLTLNERSQVLTKEMVEKINKPIQLIVPDGNWRQANKMGHREKALKDILWVKIDSQDIDSERTRMRREHSKEGMSTLEAIAKALGVIEGSQIETVLDDLYVTMTQRTISTRPNTRL